MSLPHVLKRIRLELARSKEFPLGSPRHGSEFVAPIDSKGQIDPRLWQKYQKHCGVRRFWNGADEEFGRLRHKPGGAEHARWVFDYNARTTDDDEAGYRFGAHAFAPGEYVSIDGHEGGSHTFKVVSVEPAA
jgi:hypothetical protein